MFVKTLRQKKCISQEKLADMCGLSLRTIQRAEAGHRVGYASLKSLAATFEIDVGLLEQELEPMEKISNEYCEFKDLPQWVKWAFGYWGVCCANRRQLRQTEICFNIAFVVFFAIWIGSFIWPIQKELLFFNNITSFMSFACGTQLLTAYGISSIIRLGDKYDVWSRMAAADLSGNVYGFSVFGLSKNKACELTEFHCFTVKTQA